MLIRELANVWVVLVWPIFAGARSLQLPVRERPLGYRHDPPFLRRPDGCGCLELVSRGSSVQLEGWARVVRVKSLVADLTVAEVLKDFQLRVAVGDVR